MSRKIRVLAAGAAMTLASVVGLTAVGTTAAAAQTASPPSLAGVGYVISCVTGPPVNLVSCLQNAIQQLLAGLGLPPIPGFNGFTAPQSPQMPTIPQLNLPGWNTRSLALPPALRTMPFANTTTLTAPLHQLVPAQPANAGLTTSAPRRLKTSKVSTSALPKKWTSTPIKLVNIADHTPATSSESPISAGDFAAIAGLSALGIAAVTRTARRRAQQTAR